MAGTTLAAYGRSPGHDDADRSRSIVVGMNGRGAHRGAPVLHFGGPDASVTMRRLTLCCTVLAAACVLGAPARAQAPESVYTELLKGRCKFISIEKETNEEQVKRCPGHGGAQVLTRASHTTVYLSFRWSKSRMAEDVVSGWSLGDKVEWRGARTRNGFAPYATIVRVIVKDPDTLVGGGHVLAVVRIGKRDACLAAAVDISANKEANALAREAADAIARTFACGKDRPRVHGAATRWTEAVIGVDGSRRQ
jgi:hypothetical protein